jgi:hypothetical protein
VKLIKCHIIVTALVLAFSPAIICAKYLWHSTSVAINIDSQTGHITAQGDIREGSVVITLDVNGPLEANITADNSTTAQLHHGSDTLVTEYRLSFSGNGVTKTGGSDTSYETYDSFLKATPANIKYVPGHDTVDVTLYVRASNVADNVADRGLYTATQILTVTW